MEHVTVTFKAPEDMAAWISKVAFDLDKSKSELIRACVLLSMDTVANTPSLCNRIQFEDRLSKTQR